MIPAIKSEFRKLLTVRSTYVLIGLCVAIAIFIGFYIQGFRGTSTTAANPSLLTSSVIIVVQSISFFVALAGLLLVTHEYRYNTITYSLTAARKRWYVPAAKIIVVSTLAVVLSLIFAMVAPVLTRLGLQLHDIVPADQDLALGELLLKSIYFGWAYAMFGLLIALIIRSQVGAIVTLLLFPGLGENLIGLLIKENIKYLPFQALNNFFSNPQVPIQAAANPLTTTQSALVVLGYIIVGGAVAFVLFQKRDAS